LYKTEAAQVPKCVELALLSGVQHFDVASQYGTNEEVGSVLKSYISKGMEGVPNAPKTKSERRQQLFISHKVSNVEQSDRKGQVKRAVKMQMKQLGVNYLDLCSVHSPLTDQQRRLATYQTLLELQSEGIVRAVGVCNYGVNPSFVV
jgi:2,5-diketo-D-gluconate reductase A